MIKRKNIVARVFTLEVDGKPTVSFEVRNQIEARELCREQWFRTDLCLLTSNGLPLCSTESKLVVRLATAEQNAAFRQAEGAAKPTDDMLLVYLVELDGF
jgi:hypothetical protein